MEYGLGICGGRNLPKIVEGIVPTSLYVYRFRRPCENVAEALVINLDPEWILDLCKYTVFFLGKI